MSLNDSPLAQLLAQRDPGNRRTGLPVGADAGEGTEAAAASCFGYLRSPREPAYELAFVFNEGQSDAWEYSLLRRTRHAGDTLILDYYGARVTLRGRNLNQRGSADGLSEHPSLLDAIRRHRVLWIQVTPEQFDTASEEAVVVHSVQVEELGPEG